jgi:phage tail-like protein
VVDGVFIEISGMEPKFEIEEVIEGGQNAFVHQLPSVSKHSNLVLNRGYVTASSPLADWAEQSVGFSLGTEIVTKVLTVTMIGADGQPVVSWTFENAWPVKWVVERFDAEKNHFLTETLEVSYSTVVRTLR